jgi:acetylornithine aminotransferase
MQREKLFGAGGKIERLNGQFTNGLQAIAQRHPKWIAGPYGVGAMIACRVFDGGEAITKKFLQKLFENGVISFIAGSEPARVRFLMPVAAMADSDIDKICELIEKTLAECAS